MTTQIPVLDKGFVRLEASMGDDLTVVNAARVSFAKKSDWVAPPTFTNTLDSNAGLVLSEKDTKLIKYLATHNHWTPFAHCQATLHMKMPIFVAAQFKRHTVGLVYNEVSRRYVDDVAEFYTPAKWRGRPQNGMKQGSSAETIELPVDASSGVATDPYYDLCEHAHLCYLNMVNMGIAPEQARMVLPQSTYTEFWVTGSLAAFARIFNLRTDPHAQWEIQQYALAMGTLLQPLWPVSWDALTTKHPPAEVH